MKKRPFSLLCLGLIASLTAANVVQSAGVNASASATIIVSTAVATVCGETQSAGVNGRCLEPVSLQVAKDGTLNSTQGVSLTLTREVDASDALKATRAYD